MQWALRILVMTLLVLAGELRAEELPAEPGNAQDSPLVQAPRIVMPKTQPPTPPIVPLPQAAAPAVTSPLSLPASVAPEMLGDLLLPPPICRVTRFGTFCTQPPPAKGAILPASVRGFKIADGDSPRPLDRVYYLFNFYDDVNEAVNERFDAPVRDIEVYRNTFGLEKTFLDGDASIGFRLPLNTLSAESDVPGNDGGTAVGDLMIILKYAFWQDRQTGDLLSAGLVIGTPTGTANFANFDLIDNFHSTTFQPFLGYIFTAGNLYLHGFSSIIIPTDYNDVTLLYNDIGLGYFLYRSADPSRTLTGVGPTFEVHVNNPLNHHGGLRTDDPAGTPDIVDLTGGVNFEFRQRARLALGVGTPVTGPRPFSLEVLLQFRVLFGPSNPQFLYVE